MSGHTYTHTHTHTHTTTITLAHRGLTTAEKVAVTRSRNKIIIIYYIRQICNHYRCGKNIAKTVKKEKKKLSQL